MANLDDYIWLGVTVEGQFIERNDDIRVVQYQVGKVKLTFTGSSEWDGMDIIARFRHNSIVYDVALTSSQADDGLTEGECVIPHEITDIIGSFEMALRGENDDGLVITSDPATFTVVETIFSGDSLGEPEPATPSILKQILDGEATRVSNEQARVTAESARVSAEATRQSQFTTAINNANAATENANDAAALARVNVPYNEITGGIASMTDADNGAVMEELTVHGKTVQNLIPKTETTVINGVTFKVENNGSISVTGTPSSASTTQIVLQSYALKPSTKYTLSCKGLTDSARVIVRANKSSVGYSSAEVNSETESAILTTPADLLDANVYIGFSSGTTDPVNQNFRVMLNEGEAAELWCSPGLNNVSSLEIVSARKNLISDIDGVVIPVYLQQGNYIFSCESNDGMWYLHQPDDYFSGNGHNILYNGAVIPITYSGLYRIHKYNVDFVNPQLELGSVATSYDSPASSYPINLSGRELRSLPDGTRDMLSVDGGGAVVLEQAVGCFSATASTQWTQQAPTLYYAALGQRGVDSTFNVESDLLPSGEGANPWTGELGVALGSDGLFVYARVPSAVSTVEQMRDFAAGHYFTYPLATPKTIHLPPITPPILPSPIFNVWAATDVPTTIDLSYGWDASGMLNQATPSLCREGIRNLFM